MTQNNVNTVDKTQLGDQNKQIQQQIIEASPQPNQSLNQQRKQINDEQNKQEPKINSPDKQKNNIIEQQPQENIQNQSNKDRQSMKNLDQNSLLDVNSKIQNIALKNYNSNPLNNTEKFNTCNCKKSKCLKMYCDCYAKGNSCRDTCKCIGCENTKNHLKDKRPEGKNDQEIQRSQDSNKKSMKPKQRSCNCKKSFCLKKYCECFNANLPCGQFCKCQDCKNNGDPNAGRNDKSIANGGTLQIPNYNISMNKQISEAFSQININHDKRQQQIHFKRRQKLDQDQIETKISQILKLVPEESYQTMLDFLAYYLS